MAAASHECGVECLLHILSSQELALTDSARSVLVDAVLEGLAGMPGTEQVGALAVPLKHGAGHTQEVMRERLHAAVVSHLPELRGNDIMHCSQLIDGSLLEGAVDSCLARLIDVRGYDLAWELRSLSPLMTASQREDAVQLVLGMRGEMARAAGFDAVVEHADEATARRLLAEAATFSDPYRRAQALAGPVERLIELGHAEELVPMFSDESDLCNSGRLMELLAASAPEAARALVDAQVNQFGRDWPIGPLAVARARRGEVAAAILEVAAIDFEGARTRAFGTIAAEHASTALDTETVIRLLAALSARPRPELLEDLAPLAPILIASLSPEAVERTADGVMEVTAWLP